MVVYGLKPICILQLWSETLENRKLSAIYVNMWHIFCWKSVCVSVLCLYCVLFVQKMTLSDRYGLRKLILQLNLEQIRLAQSQSVIVNQPMKYVNNWQYFIWSQNFCHPDIHFENSYKWINCENINLFDWNGWFSKECNIRILSITGEFIFCTLSFTCTIKFVESSWISWWVRYQNGCY